MTDICEKCGLPKDLCVCEDIAKEQQRVRIYLAKRRYGKLVTVTEGLDANTLETLAKKLKCICASGGTIKGGRIELQGDHLERVRRCLSDEGYQVEVS
jgi:translation initiation factor 1